MKKQIIKQLIHSTITLAMFAVVLTEVLFTNSAVPDENTNDSKAGIIIQIPEENEESDSPITPMNDLPPEIENID